jgi:hypothetical protein
LITTVKDNLIAEWGYSGWEEKLEQATQTFCHAATDQEWMEVRNCDTLDSIRQSYQEILQGTVPPSQAAVLKMHPAIAKLNE